MNKDYIKQLLQEASDAYYNGKEPILTDEQFDKLSSYYKYEELGAKPGGDNTAKHLYKMYSLKKHFTDDGELPALFISASVCTPKLDGAAISIYYVDGVFSHALTRGDGETGQIIDPEKFNYIKNIPPRNLKVFNSPIVQISGEVVASKNIPNSRNYASGFLNSKTGFENTEPLYFFAYGMYPSLYDTYNDELWNLENMYGFKTVLQSRLDEFPQDGSVYRVNSNILYSELGYTAHHPRGAVAVKTRKAGIPTVLKDVVWQVGKSGRVTPVAILEPIEIDGATISRATLNNAGFIRAMDLHYGDIVEVIRSGDIIPTIVGKADV